MRRLLTFTVLLCCAINMSAQVMMKINVKDATAVETQNGTITLPANVVKNIVFEKTTAPEPPKVDTTLTVTLSNLTESSVTIQLNLQPTGLEVQSYVVEYGTSIDNMQTVPNNISSSITLTNLQPNTLYYYIAYVVLKGNGKRITLDDPGFFRTKEHTLSQPIIQFGEIKADYTTATVSLIISGEQLAGSEYALYCSADYNQLGTPASFVSHTGTLGATGANLTYSLENLMEGTTYYLLANVATGDGRRNAAEKNFTTRKHISYVEPEPIDLGLSVKWASFNLGASTETENGGYFGWGDATGEETRYREGYYAPELRDTSIRGDIRYDIAAAKLGGHWRLPTPEEVLELQHCNPVRTTVNGKAGVRLTGIGSKSGNTIFIPFAGYCQETTNFQEGTFAYLWTDSIDRAQEAYNVQFLPPNGILVAQPIGKANLATVRAVWDDGSGSEPKPDVPDPSDPSAMAVEGTENDERTGAIPQDGVNMGLSVKWARWNVGCMTAAGGKGRYYAWGATEIQDTYTQATYESNPYYDVPLESIPNGIVSAENDVATQLWGDDWRLPTEGEFQELFLYCERTWTYENAVPGYKFTSPTTGNSVFFPAAGHISGTSPVYDNEEGRYWTANAWTSNDASLKRQWASTFYFHNGLVNPQISGTGRYQGLQVRPVKNK